MKKLLSILLLSALCLTASAEVVRFKLSPPGFGSARGLSPANQVPLVTNSTGSGDVILSGITFDTDTRKLELAVGYGSALGFSNLTGPATAWHIHGPADTAGVAGVLFDLSSLHLPAGDPAKGGLLFGAVTYAPEAVSNLLAGLNYLNIHTAANPLGELRGQLVLVTNVPPVVDCPKSVTRECTSSNGALVKLELEAFDPDKDPLQVIWTINGVAVQTNNLPGVARSDDDDEHEVKFIANFAIGTHQVSVSVSDGINPPVVCSSTVTVVDTKGPEIRRLTPTPATLWPPNHRMVPVKVSVVALDACGPVTSKIVSVTSNEPDNGLGDGDTANDIQITGDLTLSLRAERSGKGNGRAYTITVESADAMGNKSRGTTTVTVPKSQGRSFK